MTDQNGDIAMARCADDAHVAVVDLGSNSVRLVVYDRLSRAPLPRFNEKSLCRLGASIDADGNLGEVAMACVSRALARFVAISRAMGVERPELLATEAIRKASNGESFRERLEKATGLPVTILSGDDEARLAATGVIAGFHKPNGLVGDLGGGSLEIAGVQEDQVGSMRVSMPLGALLIARRMTTDLKEARRYIDDTLKQALGGIERGVDFHVVGGGWRTLAKAHLAAHPRSIPVIHGLELATGELRELAKSIAVMDEDSVRKLPGVPGRRASILPAAALVLERVLKQLEPGRVLFSSLGVREGWLYEQLPEAERAQDPLLAGCRHLAVEAVRVPAFAAALERWTAVLSMGESAAQHRLRIAACALSDIAWREATDVQARHAFERILRFPLIGVTHAERAFLAATVHARYGKRAEDPSLDLLSTDDADRAHRLGSAMLLGYRFSGSVPAILDHARIVVGDDEVVLHADEVTRVPDSDAVQARLALLAKALGKASSRVVSAS